jgi:hypothetical protein
VNEQVGHDSWTFNEGAPADVTCLAQTNDGFLWLGGHERLIRHLRRLDCEFETSLLTKFAGVFSSPHSYQPAQSLGSGLSGDVNEFWTV